MTDQKRQGMGRRFMWSRWLLFVPAGILEIFLGLLAGATATLHHVGVVILDIAYMLPSMDWYAGGDYVRRKAPNGKPISTKTKDNTINDE